MKTQTHHENGVLTVQRAFDAPVSDVFDAWIEASKTTHWWGCQDTTKVQSEIQPKVGGTYRHVMSIRGVGDYPIEGQFVEFDPPRLLSYRMPGMDAGEAMLVRVEFTEAGSGTLVVLTQSPIGEPLTDVVATGWTAAFERLGRFFTGERRAA